MDYVTLREKLVEMVGEEGEEFEVIFTKKNGSLRRMRCELALGTEQLHRGYIKVLDLDKQAYRNVNLNTLIALKFKGIKYTIKENKWSSD